MASGGLQQIMGTLSSAMQSGRAKPKHLLKKVHGMLNDLTDKLPEDDDKDKEDEDDDS